MSLSSFCVVTNALRLNLFKMYNNETKKITKKQAMQKTIAIEGMMCTHCEAHVKKALESIDGIENAIASHEKKNAVVTLKEGTVLDELAVKNAITEAGYEFKGVVK